MESRIDPDGGPPGPGPQAHAWLGPVLAGEPEAIDRWYRGEHPVVWKLCLGLLADANEADDVAQDAMLHLLDKLERFDPERPGASYESWRDTVVLNQCRDRMRRAGARQRAESSAAEARPASLPQRLPEPSGAAAASEFREVLTAALAHLPEREREAFVLCELEGRRSREAAEVLGIVESSVRSLRTLARRRLRNLLAPRLGISEGGGASA